MEHFSLSWRNLYGGLDAPRIRPLIQTVLAHMRKTLVQEQVYRAIRMERQHYLDPGEDHVMLAFYPAQSRRAICSLN